MAASSELNLNHLRAFYCVVREGSFTKAAEVLHVTQPAVSQAVKALETRWGIELFQNVRGPVRLSVLGTTVFGYASQILEAAEMTTRALTELTAVRSGEFQVGASRVFSRYLMPDFIPSFRASYPQVDVQIQRGSTEEMVRTVEHAENAIAVVGRVEPAPHLRIERLRGFRLLLVSAPNHPLQGQEEVQWHELRGYPLILWGRGNSSRWSLRDRLSQEGVVPTVSMETSCNDAAIEFMSTGRCLAFVYEPSVMEHLRRGVLSAIKLPGPPIEPPANVVSLADVPLSSTGRTFIKKLVGFAELRGQMRKVLVSGGER